MSAKRGLRIRGLRQRWLVNAVLPIVLVVIAIVTVYTLGVRRTYYSAMRSGLETRARVAADNFSSYGLKSYSEYFRYASITAETFEEKDRLELQFINVNGRVQVSSYGLTAGTQPGTSDVTEAVATGKPASFEGLDPQTGERILSVSAPLRFNGRVIGRAALRHRAARGGPQRARQHGGRHRRCAAVRGPCHLLQRYLHQQRRRAGRRRVRRRAAHLRRQLRHSDR